MRGPSDANRLGSTGVIVAELGGHVRSADEPLRGALERQTQRPTAESQIGEVRSVRMVPSLIDPLPEPDKRAG